jgi:hypothetical protein
MNYYAQGGQAHGLKSIAQELQSMGRGGDTMLAHINPREAALLKRLGGSGTINPQTGLPEYFKIKSIAKAIEKPFRSDGIIGNVLSPVTDLIRDLGPIATIAAGIYSPWAAGIVGGLQGEKGFDLKRALLTGAMAYGAQNLAKGLQASSNTGLAGASDIAAPSVTDVAASLGTDVATVPGSQAAMLAEQAAGFGDAGLANIASSGAYGAGSAANIAGSVDLTSGMADAYNSGSQSMFDRGIKSISDYGSNLGSQIKDIGSGAYNLATKAPGAAEAFKASGATMANTALPLYMGTSGIAALDEAEKMKLESDLANAKSEEERSAIMARIEDSRQRGLRAMEANPYQFAIGGFVGPAVAPVRVDSLPSVNPRVDLQRAIADAEVSNPFREMNQRLIRDSIREMSKLRVLPQQPVQEKQDNQTPRVDKFEFGLPGAIGRMIGRATEPKEFETTAKSALQANPFQFAYGGSIDDATGRDDLSVAGIAEPGLGNLKYGVRFAQGGQPRFLSGGGDGMSDDIPATINGKQPARLADGEFVIPADVVSHLGNGSSKAGAKKLYSMMDKVRVARTGNKKQGKEINPNRFMPA